jgi:flagellar hook protein FlgE
MKSQDGYASGALSAASLDEKGVVKLTYTNGQKADAGTLALAQIDNGSLLVNTGESLYSYSGEPPEIRVADADLKIKIHSVETSNVNLTDEFSNLILMQRGYQASSQVLSTANDMIQELFDMKGRR